MLPWSGSAVGRARHLSCSLVCQTRDRRILVIQMEVGRARGYFHIRRSGGLGPDIRQNLGQNLGQLHKIRGSVTARCKSWERITILGHLWLYLKFKGQNLGYLSPIFLKAKFGAPTRISKSNFGAKPPTS